LILVTHHLDEVPPGMTHVLMLRDGNVVASGPIDRTLTSANLSDCFGLPLVLQRTDDGRFTAWSPRAAADVPDQM
jgi:iron complex transport system ATP-binding protein